MATGQKLGGTALKAPTPGPRVDDQINLTDDASRIMPVAGDGFEQCYNAQAMVDPERMTNRLKTGAGRATYALHKQTVDPVFGIIKSVIGFRQFLTRELDNGVVVLRLQSGKHRGKLRF